MTGQSPESPLRHQSVDHKGGTCGWREQEGSQEASRYGSCWFATSLVGLLLFVISGIAHVTAHASSSRGRFASNGRPLPNNQSLRTTMREAVHLVYSSDQQAIQGVEASIRSVRAHASEDVVIHFVGDAPLRSMPFVNFIDLSHVAKKYKLDDFINEEQREGKWVSKHGDLNQNLPNYVRFVMDELLPGISKAMWIDADTIVKCDVVRMVRSVLNDKKHREKVIAAVPVKGKPQGLHRHDQNGNKIPDWDRGITISFNAGVYVVNLNRWREQNMTSKIRQLALLNREEHLYKYGSQPPLALTIGENFEQLPPAWNVKVAKIDKREDISLDEACVLHWSGPRKPWFGNGEHPEEWIPYNVDSSDESEEGS